LYGRVGKNFVKTILNKTAQGEELRVVNDQVGCPTYAKDLAEVIVKIIKMDAYGVYHAAGQGTCSWFEFASEILRLAGYKNRLVAIKSWELDRLARRPRYSALNQEKLNKLGVRLRAWQEAIDEYIQWDKEISMRKMGKDQ